MKKTKDIKKRRCILSALGFITGIVNGFFGSGGGMIAVESLERSGCDSKRAHASSIFAILPLSIVSAAVYLLRGSLSFRSETLWLLGGASFGGLIGALLLGKLSSRVIDHIFTALMLFSGIRMVFS